MNSKTRNKAISPDLAGYIMDSFSPKNLNESYEPKINNSISFNSANSGINNKIKRKLKAREVSHSVNLN